MRVLHLKRFLPALLGPLLGGSGKAERRRVKAVYKLDLHTALSVSSELWVTALGIWAHSDASEFQHLTHTHPDQTTFQEQKDSRRPGAAMTHAPPISPNCRLRPPQTISTTHRDSELLRLKKFIFISHPSSLNLPPLSLQTPPFHPTPRLSSGGGCDINIWDSWKPHEQQRSEGGSQRLGSDQHHRKGNGGEYGCSGESNYWEQAHSYVLGEPDPSFKSQSVAACTSFGSPGNRSHLGQNLTADLKSHKREKAEAA